MLDVIPWNTAATNDEGYCGTLREVVLRWKAHESRDHEALTGVSTAEAVYIREWGESITDLLPSHLDQLADRLDVRSPYDRTPKDE